MTANVTWERQVRSEENLQVIPDWLHSYVRGLRACFSRVVKVTSEGSSSLSVGHYELRRDDIGDLLGMGGDLMLFPCTSD